MANGWMDYDATWYGGIGLGPGDIVLDGELGPSSATERGTSAPLFGPCLLWPNGRPSQQLLSSCNTGLVGSHMTGRVRPGPKKTVPCSTLATPPMHMSTHMQRNHSIDKPTLAWNSLHIIHIALVFIVYRQ